MHEMGIVASVLEAATAAAHAEGATRINEITLTIGELTEIVDDALMFAFEALTPGTFAEGASLVINRQGARSRCLICDTEFDHDRFERACTSCGSFVCEPIAGRELSIDSIDIDRPSNDAEAEPAGTEAAQEA